MADTGAPYFIPYVEPSDLVRNYPAANEAMADAIVVALDGAGGLVAVKSALFTGTQTNSTAAGANFPVTDLSITHALANAGNKLIISAFLGQAASADERVSIGLAVDDGSGLIAVGDSDGSRIPVGAGGRIFAASDENAFALGMTFVHSPGDTTERTYTVRAINFRETTRTLFINRSQADPNNSDFPRAVSTFIIQEVKV